MNWLFLDTLGYESAVRLSGHHYARLLAAKGDRVLSISSPVSPLHRLSRTNRKAIAQRFENHRQGFIEVPPDKPSKVFHYVPHAWVPVKSFFPLNQRWALRLSSLSYRGDLTRRFREMNFIPDVVSIQNVMFEPLAHALKSNSRALIHYRIEDLLEGFHDMPRSMIEAEKRLIEYADCISITSETLRKKTNHRHASATFLLPNGVDVSHFATPRERPSEYAAGRSVVLYFGSLREWFDWELVLRTANALPDLQFVVIGPEPAKEAFLKLPNATYIPGIPYDRLPAYVEHAAVGIIPFKPSPLIESVSPIKLFEFLAAGTPVVATSWEAIRKIESPARLESSTEGFTASVREFSNLKSKPDYREFVSGHSWEASLEILCDRIRNSFTIKC